MQKENLQIAGNLLVADQNNSERPLARILISTTVPETFATILKNQPLYLASHFQVVLATSPGKIFAQVARNEGLVIHPVPMSRGISVIRDVLSVARMVRVLLRVKPKLAHSYTPKAGLVVMLAAWLCRVPVRVHTFTGLIFPTSRGFRQKLLIWVDRLICACATHVVPEGLGVKADLEAFRITLKPLRVIGNGNIAGVDTTYFSAAAPGLVEAALALRQSLFVGPENFLFCFVGRLNRDKGLSELMGAFGLMPATAHLLLVGDVDETAPIDAATLLAIESHPRVHQLGFLDDIRAALHAASVLVLPSYREGFPNVVLQAGAMGLPVIATDINGCNEVIEPGRNGWLVAPRDVNSLCAAMHQAMQVSTDVLREMGCQSQALIQQRFERSEHWARMVEFYQELLARQKGKE